MRYDVDQVTERSGSATVGLDQHRVESTCWGCDPRHYIARATGGAAGKEEHQECGTVRSHKVPRPNGSHPQQVDSTRCWSRPTVALPLRSVTWSTSYLMARGRRVAMRLPRFMAPIGTGTPTAPT